MNVICITFWVVKDGVWLGEENLDVDCYRITVSN